MHSIKENGLCIYCINIKMFAWFDLYGKQQIIIRMQVDEI